MGSRLDRAVAVAMVALMGVEIAWLASGVQPLGWAGDLGVVAVAALTVHRFGLREVYLLTLCAGLTVGAVQIAEEPVAVITGALDQAAFLMAFILLIGLLQQAASTSGAIRECGLYLTRQPAGRRFFAVFLGTHLMAQLFNLGLVSLLAPLIQSGAKADTDRRLAPIRERRQLNAMLRGFAWSVVWSPTAVAPLVLATLLPEAKRLPWILVGLGIAVVVTLIGWAEDRYQWRAVRRQLVAGAPREAAAFPARAYGQFAAVCGALLGLTLLAMVAFSGTVVFGLMAAAPIILVGWLLTQNGGLTRAAAGAARARIAEIVWDSLPRAAPLAVTLACSGYIGRAAAALIPAEAWADAIGLQALPGWLFLLSLSMGVAALSQFALSPIMMAVFFGSLIADLPTLPADATWAALAISCGWALSMTISPFATVVLMTEQITGHSGWRVTWLWNWRFTLACTGALALAYWLLAGGG